MQPAVNKHRISSRTPITRKDIEDCLAGDPKAWHLIMVEYEPVIRRAVQWTLRHRGEKYAAVAETDDVVQEVCYRLVRSSYRLLKTYDPDRSSFGTWLCVVSRSTALDHIRSKKNHPQASLSEIESIASHDAPSEMFLSLPKEALSPRQAYILYLTFVKDEDTRDIAKLMDIHPQTVRSMRNSAINKLRHYYANEKKSKGACANCK